MYKGNDFLFARARDIKSFVQCVRSFDRSIDRSIHTRTLTRGHSVHTRTREPLDTHKQQASPAKKLPASTGSIARFAMCPRRFVSARKRWSIRWRKEWRLANHRTNHLRTKLILWSKHQGLRGYGPANAFLFQFSSAEVMHAWTFQALCRCEIILQMLSPTVSGKVMVY